jgi:hypothetical protein
MADILPGTDKPPSEVGQGTEIVPRDLDIDGEIEEEEQNSFLKNVYLQKSPYVIKGTIVV